MQFSLIHALSLDQRRVFNRAEAASYLGVSRGYFDKLVQLGQLPAALPFPGVKRWDKGALDQWLDAVSGVPAGGQADGTSAAYDEWSRSRGSN